ncbi:hypothetical protein M0813_11775 [Anaeramoeba flamelloides]|uniref:B box-type domain-containing protein n=1 Tax=Anaeramoeba flamelloides TaxID=1746091 RepID=A0ABQ8ZDK5_9EUKA|nr:hypothetical protein M0813_11775 [Anaeramoeba flamelloides]
MTSYFPIERKEKENKEEEETVTVWCDVCLTDNKKVAAIIYCHDCKENQCEECDLMHKSRKFKDHSRTDLKQKESRTIVRTNKCPIHQNTKLSRYCKNCQKLICDKCSFEHSNHETISFDQPMDFYKELINEQKIYTQNHFERINENFEQLNYSEKKLKGKKEKILREISEFYLNQKKLLDLLEQNEKKLTNNFFEQISIIMKKEKQAINNSKHSTQKLLKQFLELETNINQSNSFGFFKLFSQMELTKRIDQKKQDSEFSRLCKEHINQPYEFFCFDHKQLLCSHCAILGHRNCQKSDNFKEGYEQIQNEIEQLIKKNKQIKNNNQKQFIEKVQNEKFKCLKLKQLNLDLVKKNYQKLNELTHQQFKNMNEEISIQQDEKYFKLNSQSMKCKKEIDNYEKSEMIIKEIEICKKYNNYQEILFNFFKLKKLMSILNKNKKKKNNQLICNSKFNKRNFISNNLQNNLQNWKLYLPFDLNKTQINLPDEIQLENKLQFSILLKNQFNETINAQGFNLKIAISKKAFK